MTTLAYILRKGSGHSMYMYRTLVLLTYGTYVNRYMCTGDSQIVFKFGWIVLCCLVFLVCSVALPWLRWLIVHVHTVLCYITYPDIHSVHMSSRVEQWDNCHLISYPTDIPQIVILHRGWDEGTHIHFTTQYGRYGLSTLKTIYMYKSILHFHFQFVFRVQ